MRHFCIVLSLLGLFYAPLSQSADFIRMVDQDSYNGTPGAKTVSLEYSDGMSIKVALYTPELSRDLPPIGLIAGYTMDISYLHTMAQEMSAQGYPVFLVQPPGNGDGLMRSGLADGRDGYHNTIEGFGAMYLDGVGEAISKHFGKPVVLLGHSRAGYQTRFFLAGLRYTERFSGGKPVLAYSKEALEKAQRNFLAIGSLYSPISPDKDLVAMVADSRRMFDMMNEIERIMRRDQENLNLILNPFRIKFLDKLAKWGAEAGEHLVRKSMAELLSGRRPLNEQDARAYDFFRRNYGQQIDIPTWEEHVRGIERTQWVSRGADPRALEHALKFASRSGPTREAEQELLEITRKKNGIAGWNTMGVDLTGKPYSLIRAIKKAQADVSLPYLIFEATDDKAVEASIREAKLLCAAGHCVIEGSHGGAVLSIRAIREMSGQLVTYCEALLKETKTAD